MAHKALLLHSATGLSQGVFLVSCEITMGKSISGSIVLTFWASRDKKVSVFVRACLLDVLLSLPSTTRDPINESYEN